MFVVSLSWIILIMQFFPPVASTTTLIREEGEDVVFMFNASKHITEVSWGIRDGETSNFKDVLIAVDTSSVQFSPNINSLGYGGRVSFVGDLSKGQAWFKIINLKINGTNQYMARITPQGETAFKDYAELIVTRPVSTRPLQTSTPESSSAASSSPTSLRPTTSGVSQHLANKSISIKVVREVGGDLSDHNSTVFKGFSNNFVSEINSVYRNVDNFEKVKVISLSENSIPVKFILFFKNTNKPDEICAPLQNAIKDNRLGSLKIVPGSLACFNGTSIIAACVTIIILLVLAVVVLLIYIWRSRSNTGSIQNANPMENTSRAIPSQIPRKPNPDKEFYATIHENRDKDTAAKSGRGPSAATQGDLSSLPQHYQELQRKAPNPTPMYEPLKQQRDFDNKVEGPQTYERLQQSASGGEYQSLSKRHKDNESKV